MQTTHNMNFKKYKSFYVNGYSFCQGGGLEEPSIKNGSCLPQYEQKYGVTWKNRSEVNFGKRLSDILGIPCKNESKSGTGVDTMVRKTYEYLFENWEYRDEIFLILEKIDASRSEIFFNEIKDYFIVNCHYDNATDEYVFDGAVREHFNDGFKEYDKSQEDKLRAWFDNHYNFEQKLKQDEKAFAGLYSFCKVNNIKIFIIGEFDFYFDIYQKEDIIKFDNHDTVYQWIESKKLTISDELEEPNRDNHPGYYGHIECAKYIANFLGWTGEMKIKETKK